MHHYAAHGLERVRDRRGLQGRPDQAVLPRLRGASRKPHDRPRHRRCASPRAAPSRTGSSTSSTPASRRAPAGASAGCDRCSTAETFMVTYGDGVSDVDLGELLALPPRPRPDRDGHGGPAARALRRARLRRRPRRGVHREAADRRGLDQRRLPRLRAGALRLPRRRRRRASRPTRSSGSPRTGSSRPTGTSASGSAWTRCATSGCSTSLWEAGDAPWKALR